MRHTELSIINHVMVMNPTCVKNFNHCPREEIAAPHKILHPSLCWKPFEREGAREEWSYCYTEGNAYIIAPRSSVSLWNDIQILYEHRPEMSSFIYDWLCENWSKRFIITYPIRDNDDGEKYTYSYVSSYISMINDANGANGVNGANGTDDEEILRHVMRSKSFTICNGLMIALALHRLGVWQTASFLSALSSFVDFRIESCDRHWTFMVEYDDDWFEFYTGHILQILDFPCHYALCGGADYKVISYLLRLGLLCDGSQPVVEYVRGSKTKYVSHTSTAFTAPESVTLATWKLLFEYEEWPQKSTLHTSGDVSEPDWMGFANLITRKRRFWREWRRNSSLRRAIFGRLRMCCVAYSPTYKSLFNLIFPSIFEIYNNLKTEGRYTSRVRLLWRDVIMFYDPSKVQLQSWLRAYLIRSRMTYVISRNYPRDVVQHPIPPIPFLKEVLNVGNIVQRLHTITEYRLSVNAISATHVTLLKASKLQLSKAGEGVYTMRSSLYETLKDLAVWFPDIRVYMYNYIEKHVLEKLLCIKALTNVDTCRSHVISELVMDYFRNNREQLFE